MNYLARALCLPAVLAVSAPGTTILAHTGDEPVGSDHDAVETEFGRFDPELEADRMITVVMKDTMEFVPDHITVEAGDVVRFRHENEGRILHEFVLGTDQSIDHHAEMMRKSPGMAHDEPWVAHVEPGEEREMVWKFDRTGEFEFACLIPGHYEAGMKGTVTVEQ